MTRKEREYYNELSIKAFGVKSRWRTMLKKPRHVTDDHTKSKVKDLYTGEIIGYGSIQTKRTFYLTLEMVEKAMIQIIELEENNNV